MSAVRRRFVIAWSLLAGCVGTNPDWDPPFPSATSAVAGDSGVSEGRTIAASTGSSASADVGASTSGAIDPSTSSGAITTSGTDSSTGTEPDPPCDGPKHQLCAGVCVEIDSDPGACGVLCVDCTAMFGDEAECKHGMCRPGHED